MQNEQQTTAAFLTDPEPQARLDRQDWAGIARDLDDRGWATTGPLRGVDTCRALAAAYDEDARFRSRVTMARHGFGRGEYR